MGLSLRDLQEVLYGTVGEVVSLAACNRLVGEVDQHLQTWKNAVIETPPSVVLVDGMWIIIAYPTGDQLERFHWEARRKQHDIGMFQSEHGCEGLWYLLAMRETAKQQALLTCH